MDTVRLKTKTLLTYYCCCHGNLVTIAMRYVPNVYYPLEAPCEICSQYDLRQRSYKVTKSRLVISLFGNFMISQIRTSFSEMEYSL